MKKIIPSIVTTALLGASAFAATVESLDFRLTPAESILEIRTDEVVSIEDRVNSADRQVIVDLKGATLGPKAKRRLDTSSFEGNVLLVSPYQTGSDSRVVVQLRKPASAEVTQDGNIVRVVTRRDPAASGETVDARVDSAASASASALDDPMTAASDSVSTSSTNSSSSSEASAIDQMLEARKERRFTGRPITLQLRDADVRDVLRLIGEASGFNMVIGDDVRGVITLSLVDVPWDQALDVVLQTQRLGAERSGSLLRVITLGALTQEKQQELNAKLAVEANAPRVTRVFAVNYARIEDMVQTLTRFSRALQQTGTSASAPQGLVQADSRTNSLIIQDSAENVERMRKLIEILDTQTPQVLVEGKVVEASERGSSLISGSMQFDSAFSNELVIGPNRGDLTAALFGSASTQAPTAGATPAGTSTLGGIIRGGIFGNNSRLPLALLLGESEGHAKIVSSPRVVVLNRETANVVQSIPTAITTQTSTVGGLINNVQVLQANLSLNVTPTVTNDGAILMQLTLTRDVIDSSGAFALVANRNINTRVLVDSGSTLVLGGVYNNDSSDNSSGVPWLRKLPIVGWFFGNETSTRQSTELFFFITPRIMNDKESGIRTT